MQIFPDVDLSWWPHMEAYMKKCDENIQKYLVKALEDMGEPGIDWNLIWKYDFAGSCVAAMEPRQRTKAHNMFSFFSRINHLLTLTICCTVELDQKSMEVQEGFEKTWAVRVIISLNGTTCLAFCSANQLVETYCKWQLLLWQSQKDAFHHMVGAIILSF